MTDEHKQKAEAFLKEYGELVEKHKMDLAAYPVFIPDGKGGFQIVVQSTPVDISNRPTQKTAETFVAKE